MAGPASPDRDGGGKFPRARLHWGAWPFRLTTAHDRCSSSPHLMPQPKSSCPAAAGRGLGGRIGQRASLGDVSGTWADSVGLINELIADLVQPTSGMARVIGAVAKGDLSQTMSLDLDVRPLEGGFLRTARTVNTMVDQLGSFASEVTRVARKVGTEGKLGGQADSVNLMASNLTGWSARPCSKKSASCSRFLPLEICGNLREPADKLRLIPLSWPLSSPPWRGSSGDAGFPPRAPRRKRRSARSRCLRATGAAPAR